MSVRTTWLDFRGAVHDVHADGTGLRFVTAHPEGRPTGVYGLDPEKGELAVQAGDGGRFLALPDRVADAPVVALKKGFAIADGDAVAIRSKRFELASPVTALASDASGSWLVAGCKDGTVAVFHAAKTAWKPLENTRIHRAAVTALCWEPDEPRFWSAGSDNGLFVTDARGALEPIDRAGRSGLDAPVTALAIVGEHLVGGSGGDLKVWERSSRRRPATVRSVGEVRALAVVPFDGLPHVVVATASDTLRLHPYEKGRVGDAVRVFRGALAKVDRDLRGDTRARQAALATLGGWDDADAIERLGRVARDDGDLKLRQQATEALAASGHPKAIPVLEGLLASADVGQRERAFRALQEKLEGLRLPMLALRTGLADQGVRAVELLVGGPTDDAHSLLTSALDHRQADVRTATLAAFEQRHPDDATASALAARSRHADTRRAGLVRLYQRELLGGVEAERLLRAAAEDPDADVRHLAHPLRLVPHPALLGHLRALDPDLHRAVHTLENLDVAKPKKPRKPKRPKAEPETVAPLLQAAASRQSDTRLRGATHLALLADPRALGLLLQLSQDADAGIRVRSCRALAALGDPRALARLGAMLRDREGEVRDAAFSAVADLLSKKPLEAVRTGFVAPAVDVRTRALALLVRTLRKKATNAGRELLRDALNDPDASVRSAAFKAALALDPPEEALATVSRSLRSDVRKMALTELMAQVRADWAYRMLLGAFDDPDRGNRNEAFGFVLRKAKRREPDAVVTALSCRHADLRLEAVRVLAKRVDARSMEPLIRALQDDDREVRTTAFAALQRADATEALVAALESRHEDVRIGAAATLAASADRRALPVLEAQVGTERPEASEARAVWITHTRRALGGLASLGQGSPVAPVVRLLDDPDLAESAAQALVWMADVDTLAANLVRPPAIARILAVGLAWRGDARGVSFVFDGSLSPQDAVAALLALGDDERLLALLEDGAAHPLAFRVLVMRSWASAGEPELLVRALSTPDASLRLSVASFLAVWNESQELDRLVARIAGAELPLPEGLLRELSVLVAGADGMARVAIVNLVAALPASFQTTREAEEHVAGIVHRLDLLKRRFPGLAEVVDPGTRASVELDDLVFGTLTALTGHTGGRNAENLRAMAVAWLAKVGGSALQDVVVPVLRDGSQRVRQAAYRALEGWEGLPEEALATGHRDLTQQALQTLASAGGEAVLIELATTRDDALAEQAWQYLRHERYDLVGAEEGLAARSASVRKRAVDLVAGQHEGLPRLRTCLESPFPDVVAKAASWLGHRREEVAIPTLTRLLRDPEYAAEALRALAANPTPRVADALLERIVDDPQGTADVRGLLLVVRSFRLPGTAARLDGLLDTHPQHRPAILDALLEVSGYDQRLGWDPDQPDAELSWLDDQHPRHDAVFATLLDRLASFDEAHRLGRLWRDAAWARTSTDGPLARMVDHGNDRIRTGAVEAYGWRVRFRSADPGPLRPALAHRDPRTAFLAAEGLARAGHADGISVLLASIDTLQESFLRHRAVLALGLLGDARALDPLLAIADDPQHALVEAAAEALGHLADADGSDRIEKRLLELVEVGNNVARQALTGLRHFGSPTAWHRIREAATNAPGWVKMRAVELLQFDPDDPTALFTRLLLEEDDWGVRNVTREAWRRRVGPDSLEPDYVVVLSDLGAHDDELVPRLRERGEPERLFDVAVDPRAGESVSLTLQLTLATASLPTERLVAALGSPLERPVAVAARLLGRRGEIDADTGALLARRAADLPTPTTPGLSSYALAPLFWACARHGLLEPLAAALDHDDTVIRGLAASAVQVSGDPGLLQRVVREGGASSRTAAARALGVADLPDGVLDAPGTADAVLAQGAEIPDAIATDAHRQGVVLPHLVRRGAVEAVAAGLDAEAPNVRLGAIEALGSMGAEEAEALLVAFGRDVSREEEERRAAWRSLRRSKRIREAR